MVAVVAATPYLESNAKYRDGAGLRSYALDVTTGFLNFGSLQTQKRVRRVRALIDHTTGGGGMNMILFEDGVTASAVETHTWTESEVKTATSRGFRAHIAHQKCRSIQVQLQEIPNTVDTTSDANPGFELTGLSFEVALEGGVQRNQASESK